MDNNLQVVHNRRKRSIWVPFPIIVGAGPSGLAVAACLKQQGVASLILERESCIASLWQLKTYYRLHLHLPKSFCQLPHLPFPENFPNYPSRNEFLSYLEEYRARFGLDPEFDTRVVSASYDYRGEFWRVKVEGKKEGVGEYVSPWLVVATGENAEEVVPELEGAADFSGKIIHSSGYRSGEEFEGKSVLVVGCGNSGMEVSLDLCNHNAQPSLVVRDTVSIIIQPRLTSSRSRSSS